MLSEAPSCGDLGVCRMAFVRAGMGFPTVSGHTQGRGSWQGQRQPPKSCPMEIPTIVNLSSRGSRAALSAGAARFCSFLRRPAAWKLATAPKRTEAAGAFQHVMNSFHSSSPATQAKGCVWADAGSRLHRETHVALFAEARLALDPVPINLSCHGSV